MHLPTRTYKRLWKLIPRVCTDCVVARKDEVLLIKRNTVPFKGMWCLAGGHVDIGETAEQAAIREVKEETGITAKITDLVGVYSGTKRDPRGTTVTICYLMKYVKGGGKTDDEASEVKFFPIDKIPKKLGFDHAEMISDALKVLRQGKT